MPFKKLLLFSLLIGLLYAYNGYDKNRIKLQVTTYPKVLLADLDIANKLIEKKIELTILYDKIDYLVAKKYRTKIIKKYKKLGIYDLSVTFQEYQKFSKFDKLSSAYIFLSTDDKTLKKIAKILTKNSRVTFAYDVSNLDEGVMIGLEVHSKIVLNINKEVLKESNIRLDNNIFRVVKFR